MYTQYISERLGAGYVLAGKYVLQREIGEGGFAMVYEAQHREIASLRFAVKVLHAEHAHDPRIRGRFRREAETVASLNSRNIVRVIDVGELDDQRPYIVMEFIDGRPLDSLLEICGRLYPADVLRIAVDVLKALDVAHANKVVHRDLKPANVFITQDPDEPIAAKVLDFGIAKLVSETGGSTLRNGTHTVAGQVACTPQYAAPELLTGKTSPLVDIYALGHMMAELLEGEAPYQYLENTLLMAAEHLRPDPVPLGVQVLRSGLAEVIARACAKPEAERFQSAREMLDALRRVENSVPRSPAPLLLERPYLLRGATASLRTQPDKTTKLPVNPQSQPRTPTIIEGERLSTSTVASGPEDELVAGLQSRKRLAAGAAIFGVVAVLLAIGLLSSQTTTDVAKPGSVADVPAPSEGSQPVQPVVVAPTPTEPPVVTPVTAQPIEGSAATPVVGPVAPVPEPAPPTPEGTVPEAPPAWEDAAPPPARDPEPRAEPQRPRPRPNPVAEPAPPPQPEPTPTPEPATDPAPARQLPMPGIR